MASDMPDTLALQLIQLETTGDVQENIRRMQNAVNEKAQFALLPELWNCPYDNAEIRKAAVFGEACRQAMAEAARKNAVWLAGSIPWQDPADGRIFNMAFVFDADGAEVCRYAKTHLMEVHTPHSHYSEAEVFTPGDRFGTFETPWGKMGILVCYDIRFPEPRFRFASAMASISAWERALCFCSRRPSMKLSAGNTGSRFFEPGPSRTRSLSQGAIRTMPGGSTRPGGIPWWYRRMA
jgi:predicted amidohydrolase